MFGVNHPIHLRIGDQWDWHVDVFQGCVPSELRCTNKIGRVQLVLVKGVIPERMEHVGQKANVAQQVKRHVLFETLAVEVLPHVLGVRVFGLRALHASDFIEEGLSSR